MMVGAGEARHRRLVSGIDLQPSDKAFLGDAFQAMETPGNGSQNVSR